MRTFFPLLTKDMMFLCRSPKSMVFGALRELSALNKHSDFFCKKPSESPFFAFSLPMVAGQSEGSKKSGTQKDSLASWGKIHDPWIQL